MINQSTIDKVRALPIEDVIRQYVDDLKKSGANYKCCSPFSDERTPSFSVSPSKGIFKCFSSGRGGDAISFVMQHENIDFLTAVSKIATDNSIEIEEVEFDTPEQKQAYQLQKEKEESIKIALNFANNSWQKNELPKTAKTRLWNKATREKWQLGYANDSWDSLIKTATQAQFNIDVLENADLVGTNTKGGKYDRFRNRIMFPVHDNYGNVVGFTGRTCSDNTEEPKYFYTSSNVWEKKNFLYGLHLAKNEIRNQGFAYLVEGHTDVIALHQKSRENTVGTGGSELSNKQAKMLKRYTDSVVIIADNDLSKPKNPGIKALHKNAEILIRHGFDVKVLIPFTRSGEKESIDPEEFLQQFNEENIDELDTWFSRPMEYINDYLLNKLKIQSKEGIKQKLEAITRMGGVISSIPNTDYRNLMASEIEKLWSEYKNIKGQKAEEEKTATQVKAIKMGFQECNGWNNLVPDELEFEDVEDFFLANGYFEWENRVWICKEDYGKKTRTFWHASNFKFEVLFHLYDDEFPKRLVKMNNIQGKEMIVDVRTDDMSTASRFKQFSERCGNFLWTGGNAIEKVKEYQFSHEKSGVLLETLGHQKQGFYVFSNGAFDYKFKKWIPTDENGVMEIKKKHYYVPSGNQVYRDNEHKYGTEKMFMMKQGTIDFKKWSSLFLKAYNENAMIGTMFIIATIFNDVVTLYQRSFPLMFLFGKGGSGKGAYYKRMLSLFGDERQSLKLSSKANTDKGIVRSMAQYANSGILMDEFVNDRVLVEILKGIYDKDGYTKAVRDSRFGTETTPCLSSAMVTGNEAPTDEPLLQRMFFIEINKGDYSKEQKEAYRIMLDEESKGVGQVGLEIMKHRNVYEDKFKDALRLCNDELNKSISDKISIERVRGNMSILLATYDVLHQLLPFPFNRQELIDIMFKNAMVLMDKIETGSEVAIFFNVFQYMYQRSEVSEYSHFLIRGNELCLRMNLVYPVYQKFYYDLQKQRSPTKAALVEALKAHDSYITSKAVKYGKNGTQSSHVFELSKTGIETFQTANEEPTTSNTPSKENPIPETYAELQQPDLPFGG